MSDNVNNWVNVDESRSKLLLIFVIIAKECVSSEAGGYSIGTIAMRLLRILKKQHKIFRMKKKMGGEIVRKD